MISEWAQLGHNHAIPERVVPRLLAKAQLVARGPDQNEVSETEDRERPELRRGMGR
jgi:hypothetical protein